MGERSKKIKIKIGYCSIIMFFNQNYAFNVFYSLLHCWMDAKSRSHSRILVLSLTLSLIGYQMKALILYIFWLIHLIKQRILLKFRI